MAQAKPIKVMYHSNNPNLNGAPDYGGYVSVNDLPNTTPNERLKFSAGVLGFGLLLILCAIFIIKPEPTAVQSS